MISFTSAFSRVLFYGLFVYGTLIFLFDFAPDDILIFSFIFFISSWLLLLLLKKRSVKNAETFWFWINALYWLAIFGELFLYDNFIYYDKVFHFLTGILITAIVFQYYFQSLKLKRDMVFLTVLGMLTLWEIFEYIITVFFGYRMLGVVFNEVFIVSPLDDTMIDLMCGALGAILYLLFKRHSTMKAPYIR